MKDRVDILMSTFNGQEFLAEQLNSIRKQTYKNWNLIIRDDGSYDSTILMIKSFREKFPNKVRFIQDEKGNLGSSKGFLELLKYVNSNYVMFCDQDDIWKPRKVEISLKKIKELEKKHSPKIPLLVVTDLTIIDKYGQNIIESSFWKSRNDLEIIFSNSQNFIAQSVFTGSTMLFNKPTINKIPTQDRYISYFQHDHWLTIHVSYYGQILFIRESLIDYRQHDTNVIGSYKFSIIYLLKRTRYIYNFLQNIYRLKKIGTVKMSVTYVVIFKLGYNILKLFKK